MPEFYDELKKLSENVWRSARGGVDKVANVIDRRTEITKLAAAIRRINRQRQDVVTEIGRKVYALHEKGKVQNEDLLAECEKIDDITAEMDAHQRRIDQLRRTGAVDMDVSEILDDTPPVATEVEQKEVPIEKPEEDETEEEDTSPEHTQETDLPQTPPHAAAEVDEPETSQEQQFDAGGDEFGDEPASQSHVADNEWADTEDSNNDDNEQ